MKKTLLYIFAIPIGLIASAVLPKIFSFIINIFIPFDGVIHVIDNYILKSLSGWIAVGITAMMVPSYKILYGLIMFGLCIIATLYMYYQGDRFNYLFLIGGILALIILIINNTNNMFNKENDKNSDEILDDIFK